MRVLHGEVAFGGELRSHIKTGAERGKIELKKGGVFTLERDLLRSAFKGVNTLIAILNSRYQLDMITHR